MFGFGQPSNGMMQSAGSMFIRLNKGDHAPGEQVFGTIMLDLHQQSPATQIWLTVRGKEDTYLARKMTKTNRRNSFGRMMEDNLIGDRFQHYEEQNIFINWRIPVYSFPTSPLPGQYSFSFKFALPPSVPSSFDYRFQIQSKNCFAKVTYEMIAAFEAQNQQPWGLTNQYFTVNEIPPTGVHNTKKEVTQNITSCCWLDRGQSSIVSYFEKADYIPGETAFMISEVDNTKSSAEVQQIEGIFKQVLHLRAGGHHHTIDINLNEIRLPGIPVGQKKVGPDALRMGVSLLNQSGNQSNSTGNLAAIQPTCRGKLISNEYYLVNRLKMDACICCGDHPHCALPINIRNPPQVYGQWAAQPNSWQPQVMGNENPSLMTPVGPNVSNPNGSVNINNNQQM